MIDAINLTKKYGDLTVLDGITETIQEGERIVIIGPSGSGKSTFLRCLNCMEDPTSGSIMFEGVDIADMKVDINIHRQHMGMVFQQFNLFNNKTVLENITLAPYLIGKKKAKGRAAKAQLKAEVEAKAHDLLKRIGLDDWADKYPSTLSGGQKQRLAIACAIFSGRRILILDEPTSGLDGQNMRLIAERLKSEARSGRTILVITHDRELIESCCDNIVEVEKRLR